MSEFGFDPADPIDPLGPPPRPATPPVRLGFLWILTGLAGAAAAIYAIPYFAFRIGYAYESGRAKAAEESLARLGQSGAVEQANSLFRTAATAVLPAVVNIQCLRAVPAEAHQGVPLPPGMAIPSSFGSGVVIDKQRGYIVTNGHVVQGADEILVRIGRGRDYPARLVGADSKTDLAVLQINAPLEAEASWGNVDELDIGDWVLAIGSPFTLDHTVTVGIVSAIGRRNLRIIPEFGGYEDFIQTDAAINPGNSGGPLIDLNGKIVGINTAIYSPNAGGPELEGRGGNVGIGFAISASLARTVVDQIIENGRVIRGYLGVVLSEVEPRLARQLNLNGSGAQVRDVEPNSPAAAAGLAPNDVLIELDGQPVRDVPDLRNRIARLPVGSRVNIAFLRDGQRQTTTLTVAALPLLRSLGARVQSDENTPPGLPPLRIDSVDPGSAAARSGLRPGQRLLAIGNRTVSSPDELETILGRFDPTQPIPLRILSPDGSLSTIRLNPSSTSP
ncbi:MAG: serine endoprotease DegQ [Isosphaeraceae bacterium]|jgi:S1-C subfamily serine protease|nr:MAG: serine endoprotease DegQ [Isosphaeraceae bacterium]